MVMLVYRPQPGGAYVAPELAPGSELIVSAEDAERLLATGQFEAAEGAPLGDTESTTTKRRKT